MDPGLGPEIEGDLLLVGGLLSNGHSSVVALGGACLSNSACAPEWEFRSRDPVADVLAADADRLFFILRNASSNSVRLEVVPEACARAAEMCRPTEGIVLEDFWSSKWAVAGDAIFFAGQGRIIGVRCAPGCVRFWEIPFANDVLDIEVAGTSLSILSETGGDVSFLGLDVFDFGSEGLSKASSA